MSRRFLEHRLALVLLLRRRQISTRWNGECVTTEKREAAPWRPGDMDTIEERIVSDHIEQKCGKRRNEADPNGIGRLNPIGQLWQTR